MEYLNIIFLNSLSCLIIILNGIAYRKLLNFNRISDNLLESGLYGLIFISLITLTTNFFFKISNTVSLIILIIPILFVIKEIIPKKKKVLLISIFLGLISSVIIFLENTNRPDAGLYHLPFINIINDSKIIIGSANLEFRYGHTSILQYLSASFNNLIFSEKGILLPHANIFSIVLLYLINLIRLNNNFLKVFFFIFLFNILYSMNRYSGFGNDDPGHMFYFLALCNFVYYYFDKDNDKIKNVIYFSLYAFLIKPFLILVFIFPLILLLKKQIKIISGTNIFCSIIILMWFLKNILISSCALYPVSITCIKNLEWSTFNSKVSNPKRTSRTSEAWAKDWPNNKSSLAQSEYIKKFQWVKTWKENHFKIFVKELLPQFILIFLLILFMPRTLVNEINKKLKMQILIIGFISFSLWFLKFPIYRYGQAYIITFTNSLIFFPLMGHLNFLKIQKKTIFKIINLFLILMIMGVLLKNFIRIYEKKDNKYFSYPWPKMYSFTEKNNRNKNIKIYSKNNEFIYYKPNPYTLCMFSESPCTSNQDVGEIQLKKKFGYKIYYYKTN